MKIKIIKKNDIQTLSSKTNLQCLKSEPKLKVYIEKEKMTIIL